MTNFKPLSFLFDSDFIETYAGLEDNVIQCFSKCPGFSFQNKVKASALTFYRVEVTLSYRV